MDFYYSFDKDGISYLLDICCDGLQDYEISILLYLLDKDDVQKKV